MYDELKANVFFKAAQKDCADVRLSAWNEIFISSLHPHVSENLAYFFYNKSWTETAKKECMQNIL